MATPLSAEQIAELQETFAMFDKNNDGMITPGELSMLIKNMDFRCTEAKVKNMIEQMDQDGNGKIDFNEFVKQAKTTQKTEGELARAFREFDMDGNGFITEDELYTVMNHKLGQRLDMSQINQMISAADKDRDGKVNYKEFIKLMTRK